MIRDATGSRPRVLLAFGSAFSPWLAATYAPLRNRYDLIALTSNSSVPSAVAYQVRTTQGMLRRLPRTLATIAEQASARVWPDYDRIQGLREYLTDCDVVHTVETTSGTSLQAATLKAQYNYRHVVTVWENVARRQAWHPRVAHVEARVVKAADHFIAVSERARTSLMLGGVDPGRITVVGPGITVPEPAERPFPQTPSFRFLFVGKKQRSKGVEELLQAFWLARHDPELANRRLELVFLGVQPSKGPYAPLIRRYGLADGITEIPFVPHEQVHEQYRRSHALVLPSRITPLWQEQWGMVLMEAMGHGLPVVATLSGSIPEVAQGAAIYAQPNDHHSLYLCLKKIVLLPTLWRSLSEAGLCISSERFRATDVAAKIAAVYDGLLAGIAARGAE